MTSKETNPFVLKDYLVAESPISNPSQYSQIVSANNVSEMTKAGYKILQPMNILELEQYLATEINKFLMNVRFARTCDNYVVQGLSLPTNAQILLRTMVNLQMYRSLEQVTLFSMALFIQIHI